MKKTIATRIITFSLTLALLVGTAVAGLFPVTAEHEVSQYSGVNVTHQEGGYAYYDRSQVTYTYDFSIPRITQYAADPAVTMGYRSGALLVDETLTTKCGEVFAFGSAVCLGDEYGLEEGYMAFDLCLTGGTVSAGVRTSQTAVTPESRGLWFTFHPDGTLTVTDTVGEVSATVSTGLDLSESRHFLLHDGRDTLTLSCDEQTLVTVLYYGENDILKILDGEDHVLASAEACGLYETGYCQLYLDDITGFVDNFVFTHVDLTRDIPTADTLRTIDYSTWTATDDLDRTVADNATAGDPKGNRDVGVFYFLCWVGAGQTVQDNTKLYVDGGIEGVRNYYDSDGGEGYWAEPYFGYYLNTDTWVYRKHAYMLEAAGVDFVFLDVSNAEVFISGHMALFDTWLEMRREGIDTPQIVFFCGDTPSTFASDMQTLYTTVYSEDNWDKYSELFYEWDGKPLVFGNLSGLTGSLKTKVLEDFTVRGNWAWCDKDGYWSWIQEYEFNRRSKEYGLINGGWGRDEEGHYESLVVSLGYHATTSKGRSFVNQKQANNGLDDFEFSSIERAGQGLSFANQFEAATYLIEKNVPAEDPFVLLITGWNEWVAGCTHTEEEVSFCNSKANFYYVDNFNAEFSRDAEPMRNYNGYGFGDNYYYQMVDYIRQFKGITATPVADHQGTVDYTDLSTWEDIELSYLDSQYDVALRNEPSYDRRNRYVNNTGRNDLESAKVSQDDYNMYFLISCTDDIIVDDGRTWMNLFLNTDADTDTGWDGYDYVLNRDRDSFVVSVEKLTVAEDGTLSIELVGGAYYYLEGNTMVIRVAKDIVELDVGLAERMIFKWADNSVDLDDCPDPMGFMDLGDTAPDSRYDFLYLCDSCTTRREADVERITTEQETTALTYSPVIRPTSEKSEITVKQNKVDILYDIDQETSGQFVTDSSLIDYFEFVNATSTSKAQIVRDGDNGNFIRMSGYCDFRTWTDIEGDYEISVDLHMVDLGSSAVYIRGEMPGALAVQNPANFYVRQVFNYYEWDWYAENGGRTFGGSSTAGSGIGIYPGANDLTVRLKRYAPDGLTVASASYTFPYPASVGNPTSEWMTLRCVDDGNTASIYLNDALICTVRMENPGVIYESDGTGQAYYGLATLCDANGTEVLTVENTRLNSLGSQLALTTRNQTLEFDNIRISFVKYLLEGGHTEMPLKTTQTTVTYTPDTRLLDSLLISDVVPEYETEVDTTAETESNAMSDSDTEPDQPGDNHRGCASAVTAPVLGMVTLALAVCLTYRAGERAQGREKNKRK